LFALAQSNHIEVIDVVALSTQRRTRVLPAPQNAVDVFASLDGRQLYVLVGTSSVGNLQVFDL